MHRRIVGLQGRRISLMEHTGINANWGRKNTGALGFLLKISFNGREAIEKALVNPYDLVRLWIYKRPGMDGLPLVA